METRKLDADQKGRVALGTRMSWTAVFLLSQAPITEELKRSCISAVYWPYRGFLPCGPYTFTEVSSIEGQCHGDLELF